MACKADPGVASIQHHVLHDGPRPLIPGLQPPRDPPPMAGAQLEAAWGGQQRHGLQSNPAGGMEPEAWQKLKQLRCKRKLQHCGLDTDALVPDGAGRVLAAASRRMKQSVKSRS